jgi:hypothetical protein
LVIVAAMDPDLVSGVVGAGLGAALTAGATWWVSVRLDRQREHRRLIAAIDVVTAELTENGLRIERGAEPTDMTFGDWSTSKASLAGLALRDTDLWTSVVEAYGRIYEWQKGRGAEPPSPESLVDITHALMRHRESLRREIRAFSRPLRH